MLPIDLTGKRAFVAGVADDGGFGFAIARALAEAGATICLGTWPPAFSIFRTMLGRGKFDESRKLSDGRMLEFEKIYALDADFDTAGDVPTEVSENRRYREHGDVSIGGVGTVFGLAIGLTLCEVVERYNYRLDPKVYLIDRLPIAVNPLEVALVALITMVISGLATLFPAAKASSLTPVEGLRYD